MNALTQAIEAAEAAYTVDLVDTPDLLREAYALRYQVYCRERDFEQSDTGLETDEFDGHAPHVVLRRRDDGMVIGTARLVLPHVGHRALPVSRLCAPRLMRHLPAGTGEVSRFAISKERRGMSTGATALTRLALVQGLVRLSAAHGITHWCAVMEPSLLRLLRASAIHFDAMGPLVEHHGTRQPCSIAIDAMIGRMAHEIPALCQYITGDGWHWSVPAPMPLVA